MENTVVKRENSSECDLFEGIVSIRALIKAMEEGISDRRITALYYNERNTVKNKSEYAWLRHTSERLGFSIEICDDSFFETHTIGNTHGGIAARCTDRTFSSPKVCDGIKNKSFL